MEPSSRRLPPLTYSCLRRARLVMEEAGIAGEPVLVAVSAGGDSMALLEIAGLLAPELGLRLHVACIDHGLRPEARAELELAREAALRWGAAFHPARVHAGGSDEDSLRRARHGALAEAAARLGSRCILLGHTRDDQVETIVFRFLRGAGLGGLAAMEAASPPLVRPLLGVGREELRGLLRERGVSWAEDPGNLTERYARGRLRLGVLPAIEAAFGKGALDHLLDVAPRWRADEAFLETEASRLLAYASRRGASGTQLDVEALLSGPTAIRPRALRQWITAATSQAPGTRDLAAIERWLGHDPAAATGSLDLAGARLARVANRLVLEKASRKEVGGDGIDTAHCSDDPLAGR